MEIVILVVNGLWLLLGSVMDLVYRKIPQWYAYTSVVCGILCVLLLIQGEWRSHVLGGLVGLVFFLIAKITKEQIGYGDAYVLTGLGLILGIEDFLWILLSSFVILFVLSIFLILFKKTRKDTSVPFIPFLFLGYVMCILLGGKL